jgi:hypothetical protein
MQKKLVPLRREIAGMGVKLVELAEVSLVDVSDSQRLGLQCFTFGMAHAVGQINRLTPPDVHALAIAFLMDVYGYNAEEAEDVSEVIIDAARNKESVLNAIIHRGIEGHLQWQEGRLDDLGANIRDLLDALAEADSPEAEPEPAEKIRFRCPKCDKRLSVAPHHAGKKAKCPGCGEAIRVPEENG